MVKWWMIWATRWGSGRGTFGGCTVVVLRLEKHCKGRIGYGRWYGDSIADDFGFLQVFLGKR